MKEIKFYPIYRSFKLVERVSSRAAKIPQCGITMELTQANWSAWKAICRERKNVPRRYVIDYLEYDLDPEVWIRRLSSPADYRQKQIL